MGNTGGTFAHKDIAFEFTSWISSEFKRCLKRTLTKINLKSTWMRFSKAWFRRDLARSKSYIYADEADLLNVALFGKTAKQWREENQQLIVLSNLESINAMLIHQGISQPDRLQKLNEIAIMQMRSLLASTAVEKLK